MADWVLPLFAIVVGVALFIEMLVIAAAFVAFRRLTRRIEQVTQRVQGRYFPLISRFGLWLDEAQPHASRVIFQASEFAHSARKRAEEADRKIAEIADQFQGRLVYSDEVITEALEKLEGTGAGIRRTVLSPIRSAKAALSGIQTASKFYRGYPRQAS